MLVLSLLFYGIVFAAGTAFGWGLIPARTIEVDQVRNTDDIRDFPTLNELESWLKTQEVRRVPGWICQDYALWLSRQAYQDGYFLPVWVLTGEAYNFWFTKGGLKMNDDDLHMINTAKIDGNRIYIEPQTLTAAWR